MFWLHSSQNNPDPRADSQASPGNCYHVFPGWVPVTLEQSLPCPVPPGGKMAWRRDAQARDPTQAEGAGLSV